MVVDIFCELKQNRKRWYSTQTA